MNRLRVWWCKRRHQAHWQWKGFSWGGTRCWCTLCGREWDVPVNFPIKE